MTTEPRLAPLPAEEWDDTVRKALSPLLPAQRANPHDAGNVLGTLVRHPDLARGYLEFNAHLLVNSTLTPRVREVALLRAVQARRSTYLWDHHIPIAQRAGLTSFISAQNEYSLVERSVERELIPACNRFDVSVIPYYPLAGGFLSGKYTRGQSAPHGDAGEAGGGWCGRAVSGRA